MDRNMIKCSEIIDVRDGTHDSPKYQLEGYPLVTSKNIKNNEIDFTNVNYISKEDYKKINTRSSVDNGDILMPMIGTVGNPVLVQTTEKFAIKNVALFKLANNENVDCKYFYYLLNSNIVKNQLESNKRGGTQNFVSLNNIRGLMIPLFQREQQRYIATVLDKAQGLIDKRKSQIESLHELVKSQFIEMFGNTVINSKGWDIKNLGTLGYFKNGMNYKQSDSGFNIKFLGVGEFKYGNKIDSSNILPTLGLQEEPNEEYILKKGDIVFVRSNGSKELVGRSILVRKLEEKTTYSGFCIRYRNQCEDLIPDFLIHLFADENFKKAFKNDSRGVNINNLNQQMLSSLKIIVPPLELQSEFADFVNQVDKLKFEMQKSLEEMENNFNSLMQRAFKGELFK